MPSMAQTEEALWQHAQAAVRQEFYRCQHTTRCDCLSEALDHAVYEIARLRREAADARKAFRRALKDARSLDDMKRAAGVRPRRSYKVPQIRRSVAAVLAGEPLLHVAKREGVPRATLSGWIATHQAEQAQRPALRAS